MTTIFLGANTMTYWDAHKQLLIKATDAAVRSFLAEPGRLPLKAIGFWNCVGIGYVSPPPFAINANPLAFHQAEFAKARAADPSTTEASMRWDSGHFQFPACIELGADVAAMVTELNELQVPETAERVNDKMSELCCQAIAAVALSGVLGDPADIDFVIQSANDSWYENELAGVRARDAEVRRIIREGLK
jgi:hypothetical protein